MRKQDKAAGLSETRDKYGKLHPKYDPSMALEVIERIAQGELLIDITSPKANPPLMSRLTFMEWVQTVPELREAYDMALQLSASAFEELALREGKDRASEPGSPQKVTASKNLMQQYAWSAERRDPGRFGQKNNVNLLVPVHISTPLDLGESKRSVSEDPEFYKLRINAEEGEFREIPEREGEAQAEAGIPLTREEGTEGTQSVTEVFRSLLRPDEPFVGMDRQPLLVPSREPRRGPAKRQLKPRVPGIVSGAEIAQKIREQKHGIPSSTDADHEGSGRGRGAAGGGPLHEASTHAGASSATSHPSADGTGGGSREHQSSGLRIIEVGSENRVSVRSDVPLSGRAKPTISRSPKRR